MDLNEAETILWKITEKDFDLSNNLILLKKFVSSWIEGKFNETKSVAFVFSWYKTAFIYNDKKVDENRCLLAAVVLEELLQDHYLGSVSSDSLFSRIILPFHKMMSPYFGETFDTDFEVEILLSFVRIHSKLALNALNVEQLKKYGLWKPVMLLYLKNNKYSFLLQNLCTDYLNTLISSECLPDELFLLFEIMALNIRLIKSNVEASSFNDQSLFRSLRLLYRVLTKHNSKLNVEAFNLISRKCYPLIDFSMIIANSSNDTFIIKYAISVFVLMKFCLISGNEDGISELHFERLIQVVGDTLINSKFIMYFPELCSLFEEIFRDPIAQEFKICVQVISCRTYLEKHSITVDSIFQELKPTSENIVYFIERYSAQLLVRADLSELTNSIMKTIGDNNSHVNFDQLLHFLNSVLKTITDDGLLSDELYNFYMNTVHAFDSVLIKYEYYSGSEILDITLETIMRICELDLQNRIHLKLAAYHLCCTVLKRSTKLSESSIEFLIQIMIKDFHDKNWEVRDCVLELMIVFHTTFSGVENQVLISNQNLRDAFCKTLFDEESYVRATMYKVLSVQISVPNCPLKIVNEELLELTVARFVQETEYNVRGNMLDFIKMFWRRQKILNGSLLTSIYEIFYRASSLDLSEEIRLNGLLFWQDLVLIFIKEKYLSKNDVREIMDRLASVGCLQAVVNAIEDEYDEKVMDTAMKILHLLLSVNSRLEENYACNSPVKPAVASIVGDSSDSVIPIFYNLPQINRSHQYISSEDFFNKCSTLNKKQMEIEELNHLAEFQNLENLLEWFKKVTFDSDINEKDCY